MKNIIRLLLLMMILISVFNSFSSIVGQDTSASDSGDNTDTTDQGTETGTHMDDDHHDDGISDDEIKNAFEREVQVEADKEKVKIESQLKNGESKDKLQIQFEATSEEPEIEFKYSQESNSLDTDLEYKIKFEQIIEYLDNGTVGNGYQEGEEVSFYRLDNVGWNDLVASVEMVGTEEINVFTASTADGVFTLVMKISSSIVNLDNTTFTPNSLKFDIQLSNFNYQGVGTSLAIETKVKSQYEQEYDDETEEEELGFGSGESEIAIGGPGAGYFSWAEYAMADGTEISVLASNLTDSTSVDDDLVAGEKSGKLYFSFIASDAADIVWDPKVGVVSAGTEAIISSAKAAASSSITPQTTTKEEDNSDDSPLPIMGIWLSFILIFSIGVIRRRKN